LGAATNVRIGEPESGMSSCCVVTIIFFEASFWIGCECADQLNPNRSFLNVE
jgi:hypothetical protein